MFREVLLSYFYFYNNLLTIFEFVLIKVITIYRYELTIYELVLKIIKDKRYFYAIGKQSEEQKKFTYNNGTNNKELSFKSRLIDQNFFVALVRSTFGPSFSQ